MFFFSHLQFRNSIFFTSFVVVTFLFLGFILMAFSLFTFFAFSSMSSPKYKSVSPSLLNFNILLTLICQGSGVLMWAQENSAPGTESRLALCCKGVVEGKVHTQPTKGLIETESMNGGSCLPRLVVVVVMP